ncbi:MAG: hypothetical protein LQ347_006394, partial [Umbilicaria vellea]
MTAVRREDRRLGGRPRRRKSAELEETLAVGNVAGEEAEMGGMNGRKAGMEDGSEDADGIED